MKIAFASFLLVGQAFLAGLVFAECEREAAPDLPDGASATMEEMVAGQGAVKAYVASSNSYLECMDAEMAAIPEEETDARVAALESYNAAVDEQAAVAEGFNEQIRAFKAANP